ncbi:MAG: hypothetical protein R2939_10340 [Kofleriaceae bacterium]
MNRLLVSLCVAALGVVLLAPAAPARAAGKPQVAVLGLEVIDDGTGLDPALIGHAKELTEALRRRPKSGTGPYQLAAGSERDLAELKFIRNCENEASDCMAQIGSELGVAFLIYGKLEKRPGGVQVSLKLFGVGGKQVMKSLSELIPTAETTSTELERASKAFYAKLTGATLATTVSVNANVRVGKVLVDGVAKADLVDGTAQLTGLANGRREIAIESPGFILGTQVVTVKSGADLDLHFTLTRAGAGDPLPGIGPGGSGDGPVDTGAGDRPGGGYRAAFWGSTVVAVASAATWIYGYTQQQGALDRLKQNEFTCPPSPANQARDGADCDLGEKWETISYFTVPLTFVAGALAGYTFYKGYVASSSADKRSASAKRKARGPEVVVVPTATPQGAGATVRIDF